jgi:hypothetical protein
VSKKDLQIELAPIRTDLTLIKWMLGLIVAGVAALVLKSFSDDTKLQKTKAP